ncbi:chorismate synthase [Neomoorella thermoacetica]|uniref:Chorismate synthase n=1 Tax=Moorella thermoacetica (strain ATCC 39073 / JCM 9320) TaxID=264732 RepID=AROC_MOOTA|nr:chorismate synthase [Moorella thermoacetica]Q2RI73.1 RecName: Full=Chorismate synthase; Short=CS; AltName: Full=5-enolpyruvylshikimate-3-phosphate phospholyase [Moorella thermoacetica ATCC 39073]AKX96980.1 chorismate synthase [Moorella thermoacetica]OIQ54455.1 chorismate synthase [Moorella thermoacetica]OIQ58151.1 chorismate synthase [Moorella thermoacetica]QDA00810.1 Chorismate synthase [Moorella thermoacetica]TYL11705.1 Chorismate synthase [Moorella thermoacetica]
MLRYLTAGESHGRGLSVIVEGLPAGVPLTDGDINTWLTRRQGGYGRGGRMAIERDQAEILAGVRGGLTLGSPIALFIANRDWENWQEIMAPGPEARAARVVTRPRPGHADLAGGLKYHQADLRNILERASARETAARVAAGAVAAVLLKELAIELAFHVVRIGPVEVREQVDWEAACRAVESPVYCADPEAGRAMVAAIEEARQQGDTLGGVVEVLARGVPAGLGSHVHWDRRLDGRLAQALMSIPAIKGVEIGAGFRVAALPGSRAHDAIAYRKGQGFYHPTNRAGGLEGGLTNGETLVLRAAMKPIPTLMHPLPSVDLVTKQPATASIERSDVCAVPAAAVVAAAAVAWVLAGAILEQFGGDYLPVIQERLAAYRQYLQEI